MAACILVVEDDRDLRECLVDVICAELPHLEVRHAANGRQALAAMQERTPTLVLLDMLMPVMNGPEFLGALETAYPGDTPRVIILSAADEEHAGVNRGRVVDALRKPVDMEELVNVVRRWSDPGA
ncbi:MAG TPA: response regulator [Myxococcaceae bacterium]|nr:response regulator [Myxococcaceae bacterium]